MTKNYTAIFSPGGVRAGTQQRGADIADNSPAGVYVFSDEITFAVNIALATNRPLLVRGASGCGKTSLARSVAEHMGCAYRETVITARTQARDLLWTTDLLRRLQDAQTGDLSSDWGQYIVPGPIWWAFDSRGASEQYRRAHPNAAPEEVSASERTVLLIDEIDKADPDVPNSLLRPIGDLAFDVEETGQRVTVQDTPPLVIVTTNEERDLPPAFLRRCVELNIPAFTEPQLVAIGRAHFPGLSQSLLGAAAQLVASASKLRDRREANPAEYLDTLRACSELNITTGSEEFKRLSAVVLGTGTAR